MTCLPTSVVVIVNYGLSTKNRLKLMLDTENSYISFLKKLKLCHNKNMIFTNFSSIENNCNNTKYYKLSNKVNRYKKSDNYVLKQYLASNNSN